MFRRLCFLLLMVVGLPAVLPVVREARAAPRLLSPVAQLVTPTQRRLTPEEQARAQRESDQVDQACATGCRLFFLVDLLFLGLEIAMLIWVARDARARGMDNSVLWMLLVLFTNVIGLVIYLLSRPRGTLVVCPYCRGKRLAYSAVCPHCRHA